MAELRWECFCLSAGKACALTTGQHCFPAHNPDLKPKGSSTLNKRAPYSLHSGYSLTTPLAVHSQCRPFALPKMLQALLKGILLQEDFLTLSRPQSRMNTSLLHSLNDSVDVSITKTSPPLCICSSQPSGFQDSRGTVPILLISICPGPSTVLDTWMNGQVN